MTLGDERRATSYISSELDISISSELDISISLSTTEYQLAVLAPTNFESLPNSIGMVDD